MLAIKKDFRWSLQKHDIFRINMKKVLVIGGGGREHALCWHLKNAGCDVLAAPGSDAISKIVKTFSFKNYDELAAEVSSRKIEEVIVGPEKYLADGISDALLPKNISIFGPTQSAARLESDKAWAKEFLDRHKIPTAASKILTAKDDIAAALKNFRPPYVVKASGLAAGKGVWIGDNVAEALQFAKEVFKHHDSLVIEEFLDGEEISYFILIDGENFSYLGSAQDHKRLLENDRGPNTGGMGAYAPIPILTEALQKKIEKQIVAPTLNGLKKDKIHYRGFLFIGLMVVNDEPYVLEFNCRMGDPETQSLMIRLKTPLSSLIDSLREGNPKNAEQKPGVALNVIVAARGYPDQPSQNFELPGLDSIPKGIEVFHSGTKWNGKNWIATGGRLFSVCTLQPTLFDCQSLIYPWIESLPFLKDVTYRKDIGVKAYKHLRASA
jgi:phosphoribosylamine--glycine ligase